MTVPEPDLVDRLMAVWLDPPADDGAGVAAFRALYANPVDVNGTSFTAADLLARPCTAPGLLGSAPRAARRGRCSRAAGRRVPDARQAHRAAAHAARNRGADRSRGRDPDDRRAQCRRRPDRRRVRRRRRARHPRRARASSSASGWTVAPVRDGVGPCVGSSWCCCSASLSRGARSSSCRAARCPRRHRRRSRRRSPTLPPSIRRQVRTTPRPAPTTSSRPSRSPTSSGTAGSPTRECATYRRRSRAATSATTGRRARVSRRCPETPTTARPATSSPGTRTSCAPATPRSATPGSTS